MPLLRFRPKSGRCKICYGGVEIHVDNNSPATVENPDCGQAIEKCTQLSAPQAKVLRKPSASEAKSARFQVYKRLGKGEYQKQ